MEARRGHLSIVENVRPLVLAEYSGIIGCGGWWRRWSGGRLRTGGCRLRRLSSGLGSRGSWRRGLGHSERRKNKPEATGVVGDLKGLVDREGDGEVALAGGEVFGFEFVGAGAGEGLAKDDLAVGGEGDDAAGGLGGEEYLGGEGPGLRSRRTVPRSDIQRHWLPSSS